MNNIFLLSSLIALTFYSVCDFKDQTMADSQTAYLAICSQTVEVLVSCLVTLVKLKWS